MGNTGFFGISGAAGTGQSGMIGGAFGSQTGGMTNQTPASGFNAGGTAAGAFSSTATAAGAFNSSTNFYGQDVKTGMISYPTQY